MIKEIVSDEFIQYKTGFVAGKEKLIEFTKLGVGLDFQKEEDVTPLWYRFGYLDGNTYFSDVILSGKDILSIRVSSVIKELFMNRVIAFNKETGEKISMGSFQLR